MKRVKENGTQSARREVTMEFPGGSALRPIVLINNRQSNTLVSFSERDSESAQGSASINLLSPSASVGRGRCEVACSWFHKWRN